MPIPYVTYGGSQLLVRPPYCAENVSLYAFLIEADVQALQRMLDERLNTPLGLNQRFVPAGSLVMIVFNKIGKMYSRDSPDRDKGWFSEQETAIWVRVADEERNKSFWFHPYMFVDNAYAMALGREVYGFPKTMGWFEIPDAPDEARKFSMETLALLNFTPETQGVRIPLIQARRTHPVEWPHLVKGIEFLSEITGLETTGDGLLDKLDLVIRSISDLTHLEIPMVFLKEFPAGDKPDMACFQAAIECTAQVNKVHGVRFLPGQWQIEIADAASHPIVRDLGLSNSVVDSTFQLWANFDMSIGLGYTVAQAREAAAPKKIAILGGGVGAMATALELTREPDWKSRYDITIYQMGWRLGGTGASGRGENGRIEEHGLHIWLGFYENAFRIMREVYEENKQNRKLGSPLRDWKEAFKAHSFVALMDRQGQEHGEQWLVWPVDSPAFPGEPGDGDDLDWSDTLVRIWGWLGSLYEDSAFHKDFDNSVEHSSFWPRLRDFFPHLHAIDLRDFNLAVQIHKIRDAAVHLKSDRREGRPEQQQKLATLLGHFRESFREKMRPRLKAGEVEFHRLYEVVEIVTAISKGLLECGYLLDHDKLDTLTMEFQDWLKEQGADPIASDIRKSCVLRGLYDLVFAYRNGEITKPSFEAGVALRCVLLIMGSYKGAIFWKMQSGMGDTVFGPMYEVLRKRGVKIEFFHQVERLELNAASTAVSAIDIGVQATPKELDYEPLVVYNGLPSWPAQPRFELLKEGDELKASGQNLESFWSTWKNAGTKRLEAGKDFHYAVLAISIGAIPYLFDDQAELPERFRLMLEKVETVRTQAMQLWVSESLEDLAWEKGPVVLDAYTDPVNTWAVMDQVLERETWPGDVVKSIHYFCGQMEGGIPPREETNTPELALRDVQANCEEFGKEALLFLLPNLTEKKIVSRYLRANIDPSDRYVL